MSHAQIMLIGIRKVGKWELKKEGRRIIERRKLKSKKKRKRHSAFLPWLLSNPRDGGLWPTTFLTFLCLAALCLFLSLFIFSQKVQKDISLSLLLFKLSYQRQVSLPLLLPLWGHLPFVPISSLTASFPTTRHTFQISLCESSLVSYYKTWYCSPNTRTKQSSVNEPALTLLLLLLLLLLHLLLHVMVFFLYLP